MDPALSTLPPIHGTLFVNIDCGNPLFFLLRSTIVDAQRKQSWTLNRNNRATIVDVSYSRSYSRIVYFVLLISFFHILLINSKFSILQHIPTCLLKPFLKHPKGFRTKGFLLVPIALTDMVVIRRPKP